MKEIIGSINGNCTFNKQVDENEALSFMKEVEFCLGASLAVSYRFDDGTRIVTPSGSACAFWTKTSTAQSVKTQP